MNNVIKDTTEKHIILFMILFMMMLNSLIFESSDHKELSASTPVECMRTLDLS